MDISKGPPEGARTTSITIDLTPDGEMKLADEALLEALTDRGYKFAETRRGERQITYLVWNPNAQ